MYVSVSMCRCVHMSTGAFRVQKRVLQIVMSHMTWMLGTKLGFPTRVVCALNRLSSPPPRLVLILSYSLTMLLRLTLNLICSSRRP